MDRLDLPLRLTSAFLIGIILAMPMFGQPIPGEQKLDFREIISQSKEQVFPAVVFVVVVRESHESGRRESLSVSGSGVIISPDGEVLTNWHVVDKAIEVRCQLSDGTGYRAQVVGTDKDLDIALLRLTPERENQTFPYAEMGDSGRANEGDFVVAMGAPWGMTRSVSIGIISCARRYLPDAGEYSLWLQTDAAISPGNSGGPLVGTDGRILGINTRGVMYGGDMGFAIPADVIKDLLPRLRRHGSAEWSWAGLRLQPLRDFNRNIYFEGDEGVIVAGTDPGAPARQAGILDRDRIIRIDGRKTTAMSDEDLPDIRRLIGMLEPGVPIPVELIRDGQEMTVSLTPSQKGEIEGRELECPRWDLSVKEINQFDNPRLYFYRTEGVFVFGVRSPGNAVDAGLREQDIILMVDGKPATSLEDIRTVHAEQIDRLADRTRTVLTVLRGGQTRQVVLNFARDYQQQ